MNDFFFFLVNTGDFWGFWGTYLKQVRLDIWISCVKDEVQFRLVGHLWHIFMPIHYLSYIQYFISKHVTNFFSANLPLWKINFMKLKRSSHYHKLLLLKMVNTMLCSQLDKFKANIPHLPGNTLRLERPTILFLLEEFQ